MSQVRQAILMSKCGLRRVYAQSHPRIQIRPVRGNRTGEAEYESVTRHGIAS